MLYLETRNTLITIINPASSPWGWRAGMAPCRKRRGYPDPFGQVMGRFLFISREEIASRDAQAPCSHWPDPEPYFFKWCAKKWHRMRIIHTENAYFFYLSSSQKLWLLFPTCPTCTSADLKFLGNIFHLQAYTTYFHWQWERLWSPC